MRFIFFHTIRFLFLPVLFAWLAPTLPSAADEPPCPLSICNDEALWPPFIYRDLETGEITGASTEIIQEIFKRNDTPITISLLPWKRCLIQVESGTTHVVFDASTNKKRDRRYLVSDPIYQLYPVFFYLREKYPDGLDIKTPSNLNAFRIGNIFGYNLEGFPFETSQVNSGAKTIEALFHMLRTDRIDLAIFYYEVAVGFSDLGMIDLNGLSHIKVPGASPLLFCAMVSRHPASEQLIKTINEGIKTVKKEGFALRTFKKYDLSIPQN